MELHILDQLLSPSGEKILSAASSLHPTEKGFLAAYEKLRKSYPHELAKAALEIVILRGKAQAKFPHSSQMFFTREALEQSSSWLVARHRASRFRPFQRVGDLCCGIGGDAVAMSSLGISVWGIDRNPVHARMTEANLRSLGYHPRSTAISGDVLEHAMPEFEAFFCDPSRRVDGRRLIAPDDYQPPLAAVRQRFPADFPCAFKLAPGVACEDVLDLGAEVEYISLQGELKACVLWFGSLKQTTRRATSLPSGATLEADEPIEYPEETGLKQYIYDPDPAVNRSGLLAHFAQTLEAHPLQPGIAFLTSNRRQATPFGTIYEVEEVVSPHVKSLNSWFRSHQVGRVTIVKRGSPIDAEDLQKHLKLRGQEHRDLLLTQLEGRHVAIIARRILPDGS